jgi:hypothetical protein
MRNYLPSPSTSQESCRAVERSPRTRERLHIELKYVVHALPQLQRDRCARFAGLEMSLLTNRSLSRFRAHTIKQLVRYYSKFKRRIPQGYRRIVEKAILMNRFMGRGLRSTLASRMAPCRDE